MSSAETESVEEQPSPPTKSQKRPTKTLERSESELSDPGYRSRSQSRRRRRQRQRQQPNGASAQSQALSSVQEEGGQSQAQAQADTQTPQMTMQPFEHIGPDETSMDGPVTYARAMRGEIPMRPGNPDQRLRTADQKGGGKSIDDEEGLKLKLELNLDVEIELKASIHGDLTLALLA